MSFRVSPNIIEVRTTVTDSLLVNLQLVVMGDLNVYGNFNIAGDVDITGNLDVHGNIEVADGTAAEPSYSFLLDKNTGIYRPGDDQIGFSAGGSTEAAVSLLNHLSITGGDVLKPGINFGLESSDANTGMYSVGADTIGFSVGGTGKVGILGAPTVDFINGLNVGTTANIAGVRRLSATPANSWEDGHMGNSEALYFTATDFVQGTNLLGGFDGLQTVTNKLTPVGLASDALVHTDNSPWGTDAYPSTRFGPMQRFAANIINGPSLSEVASVTPGTTQVNFDYIVGAAALGRPYVGTTEQIGSVLVAQKIIPKGFTITTGDTCTIFTRGLGIPLTSLIVWSQTIEALSTVTQLNNNPGYTTNIAAPLNLGSATGDGKTAVTIVIDLGVALTTANGLSGASITMQRI